MPGYKNFTENDEISFNIVCELISTEKASVISACEKINYDFRRFFAYLNKYPEKDEIYTRARSSRADMRFEEMDSLLKETKDGKVDPHVARIIIDTQKWQMGKENKRYSEKKVIEGGDDDKPVRIHTTTIDQTAVKKALSEIEEEI